MIIKSEPLTAEAFAPYGDVFPVKDLDGARQDFAANMVNLRETARLNVGMSRNLPTPAPLEVTRLERHSYSSQVFVPMIVARWVVIVADSTPAGDPDLSTLKAFIGSENTAMCYRPLLWHHPFACLDAPSEMLMLRYDVGDETDTDWFYLPDGQSIPVETG